MISANVDWTLNGAAGTCATANQIFCYTPGGLGTVVGLSANVDASNNFWTDWPPIDFVDYARPITGYVGTFTVSPDCGASGGLGTCPPQ